MLNREAADARGSRPWTRKSPDCRLIPILALMFAAGLWSTIGFGQVVSSSLVGALVDPADASIANVEISLTNQSTRAVIKIQSNADGLFRFPNLLAGTYSVSVHAAGFKAYTQQDIVIASSETRDVGRVKLQLGSVTEQVSVTAEVTPLQTASSERSSLVSGTQLSTIAMKGRDFVGTIRLLPGVVDASASRDATTAAGTLSGLTIAGLSNTMINYTFDGVSANDTGSNSDVHYNGSMDAISEVRILTSNFQAEYGRKAGATISVITKGGTKDFHGSAYWQHRHEEFNANNFFNNKSGLQKSRYRFNVPGYSIGGPVYVPNHFNRNKEKFFFFFAEEFTRQLRDYGTQYRMMPTPLERAGNFSQSLDTNGKLITITDPTSKSPFPGNIIPATRIDPTGKSMVNFLPTNLYTDPDPAQVLQRNYQAIASGQYPRRNITARIDANLFPSMHVYWRLINENESQDAPWNQWFTGANYLLAYTQLHRPGKGQAVNITNTISPTLVNEFTFGKDYAHIYYDLLNQNTLQRSQMNNVPQWFVGSSSTLSSGSKAGYAPGWVNDNLIPDVIFGGSKPVNGPTIGLSDAPYENWNDLYSFSDSLTKVAGSHSLKAGIYIERAGKFATLRSTNNKYRGVFDFSVNANNPYDTGDAYSNAMLGNFGSYTEATTRPVDDFWYWTVEGFVQDNWRVNKRFTVDIGARLYYQTGLTDYNHNLSGFVQGAYSYASAPRLYVPLIDSTGKRVGLDPVTGATVNSTLIGLYVPNTGNTANGMKVGGTDGEPTGMADYIRPVVAPRFGFAWDVFGNSKTAVRGGFGMFFDRPNTADTGEYLAGAPPIEYIPTAYYGNLSTFASAAGVLGPTSFTYMAGDQHTPSTMSYSVGIQQSLGFSTVLDVAYVGNQGRHLQWTRPVNSIKAFAHFNPANLDATNGKPLPDNFLRPYYGYGSLSELEFSANSNYNSLQSSVRRQFTKGLLFGSAFTWSRAMGYDNPSYYFAPRAWNYGVRTFDRTFTLTINYLYDLPRLSSALRAHWLAPVTDRWSISGVTTFQSGAPYTPTLATTNSADISGSSEGARLTVVGNPNLPSDQKTFYRTFNTAAFALTPVGSFGNTGVNPLRGPGINNFDATVTKKIPVGLGENRAVEFRAEFYNLLNHTQFQTVDGTARFDPSGKQTNPTFGTYNAARSARIIAFSLRFAF
jgi:hypothetical protein